MAESSQESGSMDIGSMSEMKKTRPSMKTYDVYFDNEDTDIELQDEVSADEIVQAMAQANKLLDELNKKYCEQDAGECYKFRLKKIICRN